VMATGHHAAVCARVEPGQTVAVVGDGAVGLSAVLAAKRLGAERIIALSRHADRQALAGRFGATDLVPERGDEAVEKIRELTGGVGVDAVMECVGTGQAMETAIGIARAGAMVGFVGVPHGVELPIGRMFRRTVGVRGGGAPVRVYLPELLDDVLEGKLDPGRVFDYELACLDTLEYLRRGGRIGRATSMLGSLLSIKPLIQVENGEIAPFDRVRTRSKALDRLFAVATEDRNARRMFVGCGGNDDEARAFMERLRPMLPHTEFHIGQVGPAVGVHGGPNILGVAFTGRG